MKNTVLKFGALAGSLLVVLMIVPTFFYDMKNTAMYRLSEIIGYISMLLSLCVIFVGMRKYRAQSGDVMSFGKGLLVGTGIAVVAGIIFGIASAITYAYIHPEFMATYFEYSVNQVKQSGLPPEEIAAKIKEMEAQKAFFTNPWMGGVVMFFTVAPMGFVIAVISALLLRTKADK